MLGVLDSFGSTLVETSDCSARRDLIEGQYAPLSVPSVDGVEVRFTGQADQKTRPPGKIYTFASK